MELREALAILCRAHTQADAEVGFTVHAMPVPDLYGRPGQYVEAWQRVRQELGLPVDPAGSKNMQER